MRLEHFFHNFSSVLHLKLNYFLYIKKFNLRCILLIQCYILLGWRVKFFACQEKKLFFTTKGE